MNTKRITLCAFFVILYVLGAKITIPTGIIPLTMQTMVVILAGCMLTPKDIFLSYSVYFIMGLVGLPVFASGGGISYIVQPSFGFLLSFPIAASILSMIKTKLHLHSFVSIFPVCLFALLIVYAIGCSYMYMIFNFYLGSAKDIATIISLGATPFVLSDALSGALACFAAIYLVKVPQINRFILASHSSH